MINELKFAQVLPVESIVAPSPVRQINFKTGFSTTGLNKPNFAHTHLDSPTHMYFSKFSLQRFIYFLVFQPDSQV